MSVKVLQLVSNPLVGGTETFVLGLIPLLRREGLDVQLANLWDGGGEIARIGKQRGIECATLNVGRRRFRASAPGVLRRFLRAGRFDVVMCYGLRTTLLLRLVGRFRGGPVLVTGLRGIDDWRKWYHVWADRITDSRMDYYVGVSQSVCRRRIERERTGREKVLYIPNGIDTHHFRRDAQQPWPDRASLKLPDGRLCVSVGNMRSAKGYAFQLEVIEHVDRLPPDARFVWVGKGPDEPMLRQLAQAKGLSERIVFYGAADDVRPILAHAELFFLSSKEEGMPRAFMEAMSMGLPVLTTDVGGCPEVVRDGVDGVVIRCGDAPAAARRLQSLFDDAALRHRLARAGAERIRASFSFDRVALRYADLYRRLAARDPHVSGDFAFDE